MNLYIINFEHSAPKDTKEGIVGYFLAENDEQVFNYIDKEFECGCWTDKDDTDDEDYEPLEIYDEDYNVIGTETYKERFIRLGGEMYDEDREYNDLYYGLTYYGWELVKENVDFVNAEMITLGIVKQIEDVE